MTGEMRIMGPKGDERVTWESEKVDTVESAAAKFAELLLNGYLPMDTSGETAVMMEEFSPQAKRIVMIMPMAGG